MMNLCGLKLAFTAGLAAVLILIGAKGAASPAERSRTRQGKPVVDYNREIKPILANHCLLCHGPDENLRQAKLRLDVKDQAIKEVGGGQFTIVPGHRSRSVIMKRITSKDPAFVMPPPFANLALSRDKIETIGRWIDQGAPWKAHWSFIKPERPALPAVRNRSWPRNEIDFFILAQLEQQGLKPSPEADKVSLLRRVTFDLTGLPPAPAEIDAFEKDTSPQAYEKVVDRLLASPSYGERMAQEWLDLARYADTHGYHIDSNREMWPWRDWVIEAFNQNKPFDQFTLEQLAGDLLPAATVAQKVASGFNRNGMINYEGGADPDEYAVKYVVDRVNTTANVWLGLTMACAECHNHKYDPITTKEFYQFFAFFNNVPEKGLDGRTGNAEPILKLPTPDQEAQLAQSEQREADLRRRLEEVRTESLAEQAGWEEFLRTRSSQFPSLPGSIAYYSFDEGPDPKNPTRLIEGSTHGSHGNFEGPLVWVEGIVGKSIKLDGKGNINLGSLVDFERTDAFSLGCWLRLDKGNGGVLFAKVDNAKGDQGFAFTADGGKIQFSLTRSVADYDVLKLSTKARIATNNQWQHVMVTYDGTSKAEGVRIYLDGKVQSVDVESDNLTGSIRTPVPLRIGRRETGGGLRGTVDEVRLFNRALVDTEVAQLSGDHSVLPVIRLAPAQRSPEQATELAAYYLEKHSVEGKRIHAELREVRRWHENLDKTIVTTMVMKEMEKPRQTYLLPRGDYRRKGEAVTANVPESLPPLPPNMPVNRLALARWLVDPGHPLTSRVTVNRYWQQYFGNGIVKTANDFGSRGEWPSHPELLDWLATEFIAGGWDIKAMQKRIVMSATYRQSTYASPTLWTRDPENRLLARGPRGRLNAEMIRDHALAISGLLNLEIGGRSVFPYQPKGLWEEMSYGGGFSSQSYKPSTGKDLYRRGMYTYWKRSVPHPAPLAFDAPDREVCTVKRQSTNTPLQALVLLNDPTYVGAARALAQRILREGGHSATDRIAFAFRLATSRRPNASELEVLLQTFNQQLKSYQMDAKAAQELVNMNESEKRLAIDPCELAAWTALANVILNLHETITRG